MLAFPPTARHEEGGLFACSDDLRGMPSFPGALPLDSESMALPSSSVVGGSSSSSMTGRGLVFSTAVSVIMVSLEYSSW